MFTELNFTPLFNEMRKHNIKVKQEDTLYISLYETWLYEHKVLSLTDIKKANRLILEYLLKKVEKPTSSDFIYYLKNSKTLKGVEIDIESEYQSLNESLEDNFKKIESVEKIWN